MTILDQKKAITVSKNSYISKETCLLKIRAMSQSQSNEFYENCMRYFESLRNRGKQDFAFEDEFFYTMPAISEKLVSEK
jgi:hypothetical protein